MRSHNLTGDLMLETIGEGVLGSDLHGNITYFNPAAASILGWNEAAAGETVPPGSLYYPFTETLITEALSGGNTLVNASAEFRRLDGSAFPAEYSVSPVGSRGSVTGAVVVFRDVTREREMESRLRRSETYLEEGQRLSRTGSWALDMARRRPVYWSSELCRIYGRTPEEGPPGFGENRELHTPESWKALVESVERAYREKTGFECATELVFPGGERKYLRIVGSPVLDEAGNVAELVGLTMDVTERYLAEKSLRETLEQLSRKSRYEAIVGSIARSVHKSIDLQEVLESAAESMRRNIEKLQRAEIFLVEGDAAILKAHSGLPEWFYERVKRIPYPKGFTWKTIIERRSFYVPDTDSDPFIGPAGKEVGTKSYVSMPIISEGRAVGVVNITSEQKNAFDEEELHLLDMVANQIETAINNARHAEALRKALTEVEKLKNRIEAENVYLQEEIKTGHNFEEIVGESMSLRKLLSDVEKVAPTDAAVLIQGDTGTGKELIARAIHNLSKRRERPLVKVNCGAISSGLVESELFGHEKGAFTGANQQRAGRFELAHGGTIFLDEVADLPQDTQVKLLRVLQEGEFERVGSSKTISTDVRVIAATNRDLREEVSSGSFRADLYYRLSVFPLELPALKDRRSDIPILANFFIARFARDMGKRIDGISESTMRRLTEYDWPGNIRELENVIERAVILARGAVLRIDESVLDTGGGESAPGQKTLEHVEREHILTVLRESGWVIDGRKGAAAALGLNPGTLRFRMKKLGITRPARG